MKKSLFVSKTRCRVCGSADVATFIKANGKTYRRTFCKQHWNEYQQSLRDEARKCRLPQLAEGWQFVRAGRQRPPRGVLRAVVYLTIPGGTHKHDEGRTANQVVIYAGDAKRVWNMKTLKRLNTPAELKRHLSGIGYHVVRETKRQIVMEKAA